MISWDDAQTISQKLAQDNSSDGISFLNMMMNVGYKEVLAALNREVTETQSTSSLVANQRNYQVPPDCIRPITLVVIDGTSRCEITEDASKRSWEVRRNSQQTGRPLKYHFRPRFGVGGGILELDPIPSSALTLEMAYEATEKDLSKTRYATGTITLTNNSAVISGASTVFVQDMVGRYFRPLGDGAQRLPLRIKQFTGVTALVMENVYQGSTQGSLSYEIFEMFALPEDLHMLPIYYAEWQHWAGKGNALKAAKFEQQYTIGLKRGKTRYSRLTGDTNVELAGDGEFLGLDYPSYFPSDGVTA